MFWVFIFVILCFVYFQFFTSRILSNKRHISFISALSIFIYNSARWGCCNRTVKKPYSMYGSGPSDVWNDVSDVSIAYHCVSEKFHVWQTVLPLPIDAAPCIPCINFALTVDPVLFVYIFTDSLNCNLDLYAIYWLKFEQFAINNEQCGTINIISMK